VKPDDMLAQLVLLKRGFDLKRFLAWLEALPDSPPKQAFRRILGEVLAAVDAGRVDDVDHLLQALYFAWQADRHVEVLSPRARAELHRIYRKRKDLNRLHDWIKSDIAKHPDDTARDRYDRAPEEIRRSYGYFRKQVTAVKKKL